jgi:L-iditol 2-dehydrogenase
MKLPEQMQAARLHAARDIRIDQVPAPSLPGDGEALIRVEATGICGSDLHTYLDGQVGDIRLESPLVLGHEFSGTVLAVGRGATDGEDQELHVGQLVAVDPAVPCHRCEFCEKGHPNLCRRMHFCGLWPDDGSLREFAAVPARTCFPLPHRLGPIEGALLEPLGVALHAVDLAHLRVQESVAILGAGPIGLLILKTALLAGAYPVIITDRLPWRLELARRMGAHQTINFEEEEPVKALSQLTHERGVDVVFEAAWGGKAAEEAIEMASLGGRVIMVGIPTEARLTLPASPARRKGLSLRFSRRMKLTYPRTIRMALTHQVDLLELVTHRFPLTKTGRAFALNASCQDGIVKAVVLPDGQ